MEFRKTLSYMLLLMTAGISLVYPQFDNAGTSAMNFLKIGVGARAIGMGASQAAIVNDVSALYWNPSGMSNIGTTQVMLSNNNWIADINHNFIGAATPLGDLGVVGISISYLSMGDMKVTTWDNTYGTGETFTAHSSAIGIGWARQMNDRFRVGLHLKYLNETISNSSSNTFALDIGSQYQLGWLTIGMSIQNFGPQAVITGRDLSVRIDPLPEVGSNPSDVTANLETQSWSLPILFQIGFAATPVATEMFRVTTAFDFRDERDYRAQMSFGTEMAFFENFFLRGGVKNRSVSTVTNGGPEMSEEYFLTAGVGAAYSIPSTSVTVHFDYGYQQLHYFTDSQLISVRFDF